MFKGLDALNPRPLAEEGVWFPVRHLRGGQPVEIDGQTLELKLAGPDSDKHRAYIREYARRMARLRQASATGETDPKEEERALAECVPMIVLDWRGFRDEDGNDLTPTRVNLDRLFSEHYWIALQADTNAGQRANFIKRNVAASSTPSASASDET